MDKNDLYDSYSPPSSSRENMDEMSLLRNQSSLQSMFTRQSASSSKQKQRASQESKETVDEDIETLTKQLMEEFIYLNARERTLDFAYTRTSYTMVAFGLFVYKVFQKEFQNIGILFGVFGILFWIFGYWRRKQFQDQVERTNKKKLEILISDFENEQNQMTVSSSASFLNELTIQSRKSPSKLKLIKPPRVVEKVDRKTPKELIKANLEGYFVDESYFNPTEQLPIEIRKMKKPIWKTIVTQNQIQYHEEYLKFRSKMKQFDFVENLIQTPGKPVLFIFLLTLITEIIVLILILTT